MQRAAPSQRRPLVLDLQPQIASRWSGTRLAKRPGREDRDTMRLRITLFTAAFVMLPIAAFALLLGGMLWRRLSGVA